MIRPKEIPVGACKITLFWSIAFLYLYFGYFDGSATLRQLLVIATSILFSVALVSLIIIHDRKRIEKKIASRTIRGMTCTIGAIPLHFPSLPKSVDLPSPELYPPETENKSFLLETKAKIPAEYWGLLEAVLKTLYAHLQTPAAPLLCKKRGEWVKNDSDRHGGRSLLMHSILVADLMCEFAKSYKYEAPRINDVTLFRPLDPKFTLYHDDPLIPIIGLAHDLGKIECMIWEDGKPTKMNDGHDYKGAQILSRMTEFWDPRIDAESRRILQSILAHYHHIQDIPMERDGSPTSDRLHALLELLVKCDRLASSIENRSPDIEVQSLKDKAFERKETSEAIYEEAKPIEDDLLSVIHTVILGANRINCREKGSPSSIGWKYFLPHYRKTIVLLKEDVFIQAIADQMGIEINPESNSKTSISHLTKTVLSTLNVANLLFCDFDKQGRSVTSQLYRADFYKPADYFEDQSRQNPKTDLSSVQKLFSIESTIALQIDLYEPFAKIKAMPDYPNIFHIGKSRFGNRGVRAPKKKVDQNPPDNLPVSSVELVTRLEETAAKASRLISANRFKSLVDRELAKSEESRRFKIREVIYLNQHSLLLHDFDEWINSVAGMSFEDIEQQENDWLRIAGISEVKVTERGTRIIRIPIAGAQSKQLDLLDQG
jgi:hypothetical protein